MDIQQVEADVPAPVAEARRASAQGNPVETAIAWGLCRLMAVGGAEAAQGCARALTEQGRVEDAEVVLAQAVVDYPYDEPLLAEFCWAAHRRQDWVEEARRWGRYRERFSDRFLGYSVGSVALRKIREFDEADRIAHQGVTLFPNHPEMLGNFAWVAHHRSDWAEADRRWRAYIDAFPDHVVGYAAAGVALRELGDFDLADDLLRAGLMRHPESSELWGNYAWVAYNRQAWPEALARWTDFRDRFPSDPLGHRQIMLVLAELGHFDEAEQLSRHIRGVGADEETSALMLKFESLGFNCEFGVVQRHFGAEPLGLLRFTATPWHLLVKALHSRLEGVGEPENTTLNVYSGEYMTRDARFHMAMHTFIREAGDDREKRFSHICRRLKFLREKLVRDLTEGEKVFVYACEERLSEREILSLFDAVRVYGPGRLLLVQLEDRHNIATSCRKIREGLVIGYIEGLGVSSPRFDTWFRICSTAAELLERN